MRISAKLQDRIQRLPLVVYIVLLLAFFEPLSVEMLAEGDYSPLWNLLDIVFKGLNILFATLGYGIVFYRFFVKKEKYDLLYFVLALHMILFVISCLANGSFPVTFLGSTYGSVGMLFLLDALLKNSESRFLLAGKVLFGALCAASVLSIFLFPHGFFNNASKYQALWALGAKNNAFPFYYIFFLFLFAEKSCLNKKLCVLTVLSVIAMIIGARICQSANTTICLFLILVVYILYKTGFLVEKLDIRILLGLFALLLLVVYLGSRLQLIDFVASLFGRNATFSGRDYLWEQAIDHALANPLFGAGNDILYSMRSNPDATTAHAHSQYLDKLAKFGFPQLIALIVTLAILVTRVHKNADKRQSRMMGLMLLIYMLHMSFDTYNYNFFVAAIVVVNWLVRSENILQIQFVGINFKNLKKMFRVTRAS